MAEVRVRVAKDKEQILKALRVAEDASGLFQSYADVMVFAASLGISQGKREAIKEYSQSIDPIRQDIFQGKGYEQVINLIAVISSNEPKILASTDEAEQERIKIFEEYANAGLKILKDILNGSVDYTERILLFLRRERKVAITEDKGDEFDLSHFLKEVN